MHRDIKPSNILMHNHSGVHVIDFGLARRISPIMEPDDSKIQIPHTMSIDEYDANLSNNLHPLVDNAVHTPSFPAIQRQLTRHIATRWYRPPEIILLEVLHHILTDW